MSSKRRGSIGKNPEREEERRRAFEEMLKTAPVAETPEERSLRESKEAEMRVSNWPRVTRPLVYGIPTPPPRATSKGRRQTAQGRRKSKKTRRSRTKK